MISSASSAFYEKEAQGHALVFDSGVGGLTVVEALRALSPGTRVDYAADTGFFPYGDKKDEDLRSRLPEIAEALVTEVEPDVFVIACNTASTLALSEVRARLQIPVVGTVPAIKPAVRKSETGTIGLLATPGTVRRNYTTALIRDFAKDADVIIHGSLELVALAEAFARGETPALEEFAAAQQPLFDGDIEEQMDVVVLACTHFPLVVTQLEESAPRPVRYIDSGEAIALQTQRLLTSRKASLGNPEKPRAIITSHPDTCPDLVKIFDRYGFGTTEQLGRVVDARSTAHSSR
ncbi:MAG: glutamate racemase [Pseudomonadota bacterium]